MADEVARRYLLRAVRAPTLHRYTWFEYLQLERASNVRHEFLDGEIHAMARNSPEHSALAANVIAALHAQLEGSTCRVFTSDLRVRVRETGLGTYPDATVIGGGIERDPDDRDTVVNPRVIVEVLSDSTEAYDRGQKFDHLRRIASLEEYVLVSHHERLLELFRRVDGVEWERLEARTAAALQLASIGCTLAVDAVYAGVEPTAGPQRR